MLLVHKSLCAAAVGCLVLSTLGGAAAQAAPATQAALHVTRTLVRPGHTRPVVIGGVLSAPSTQSPTSIARAYLATRPALLGGVEPSSFVVDRAATLPVGSLVRLRQSYRGLRVIGGSTVVRMDDAGRVRWASSFARPIPPSTSITPTLAAARALDRVGVASGYAPGAIANLRASRYTALVIYAAPAMQTPRLAYWVELPPDVARLQTIRAYVDAETGFIYARENMSKRAAADAGAMDAGPMDAGVMDAGSPDAGGAPLPDCPAASQLAYVYETNPVEAPLSCVSLAPYLDPAATGLVNADVLVQNCVDNNGCQQVDVPGVGQVNVHFCDRVPTASTTAGGDFTEYVFRSDTEPEDAFSEVQMFYHVNKVYGVARALGGFSDLTQKPLTAIVNMRIPALDISSLCTGTTYTGTSGLDPFDNAAFMAANTLPGGLPEEDSIVFGQGTAGDFAYDGDVVYHEFGHAVMATVAPAFSSGFIDEHGFNSMPGGMHEGYADLMTLWVTDDPSVGEYAGSGLPGASGAIRDIDNNAQCPSALVGQVHLDSLSHTGAIYEARTAIATTTADKLAFDKAVFAVQQGFGAFDDFTTASAKIVLEIESVLGSADANTVAAIFDARGMSGCNNRVLDGAVTKALLFVTGTDQLQNEAMVPGPVQFKYVLTADATALEIKIAASAAAGGGAGGFGGGATDPVLEVVIKPGDAPIKWAQGASGVTGDFTQSAAITIDTAAGGAGTGTLVALPAGTYHLQIVNKGPTWRLQDISFASTDGDITPDAGPAPDAFEGGGEGDGSGGGDCGCFIRDGATGQGDAAGLLLLALGCALVIRRRR